jgi:4-diphosphocytidyl-2-C-methyl-D-erythritol kinase
MPSQVRSYSKINLGLAIGPPRPDGFHSLVTLYQTLALHDVVTVTARTAGRTRIQLTSNDPRVPRDGRNTAWKMVVKALDHLGVSAIVNLRIQKNLPIQGGMGAGSANAAAALIGLERELGMRLPDADRLALAAEVGSDVPLFLIGGSVLGADRGQVVRAAPAVTLRGEAEIPCVIALPDVGVSTPQAFRDWDALLAGRSEPDLLNPAIRGTLEQLGQTYASVFGNPASAKQSSGTQDESSGSGASGIFPKPSSGQSNLDGPENLQGLAREQCHNSLEAGFQPNDTSGFEIDLAGNTLLALVRTGIVNDFETVVFPQNPLLGAIKRLLMGSPPQSEAVYAALSGSGSALFGLYRSTADAEDAQQRLQQQGVRAIVTRTIPRPLYWSNMFAE